MERLEDWIKRLEDWMGLVEVLLDIREAVAVVKIVAREVITQPKRATRARGATVIALIFWRFAV